MNDKDFIEELKRKRDEYGVTQTRLAVACGISREHYNRIEKEKLEAEGHTIIQKGRKNVRYYVKDYENSLFDLK